MDNLLEALLSASAPDRDNHRPTIFRPADPLDRARLEDLLKTRPRTVVHDELHAQLGELIRVLHPSQRFSKEELDQAIADHLGGSPPHEYGVWVHYPWADRLVHLLDEAEFARVRTDRNRNKITSEEQALLATKKVGVIGLSVGQSVCMAMAMERSFGELRIADFDTLDLSNLNRIRSSTYALGHAKTVNVAREVAELDPFLRVVVFPNGATKENLNDFLTGSGALDVLIEECDSVDIKLRARQQAREHRIPVIMDTSDRGMIDIERFDLEPTRPLLHGLLEGTDMTVLERPMTNAEKLPFMARIVGLETISERMRASLPELGKTILTWPQLASAVVLGGAVVAELTRRLLLGAPIASQRKWLDLDELIPDSLHPTNDTPTDRSA